MIKNTMTFSIDLTCEWLWECKHDYQSHSITKIDQFPRHLGVLKIICRLCNMSNLWTHECKCELFVNSSFKTKWFVNCDLWNSVPLENVDDPILILMDFNYQVSMN
jgi:hypothetical protein